MSEAAGPFLLEIRGLSLEFGQRRLWKDLDLSLAAGERIAITGKSGGGKSSLPGMMTGIILGILLTLKSSFDRWGVLDPGVLK